MLEWLVSLCEFSSAARSATSEQGTRHVSRPVETCFTTHGSLIWRPAAGVRAAAMASMWHVTLLDNILSCTGGLTAHLAHAVIVADVPRRVREADDGPQAAGLPAQLVQALARRADVLGGAHRLI